MAYDSIGATELDEKNARALFEQVEANIEAVKGGTAAAAPINTIAGLDGEMTAVEGRASDLEEDMATAQSDITDLEAILNVPTGAVLRNASDTVPTGYLLCDGSSKLRSSYVDLFMALTESVDECEFDITTDTVLITAHGLFNADRISFEGTGPLPNLLTAGTSYYVNDKSDDAFNVESAIDGGNIEFAFTKPHVRKIVGSVTFDGLNNDVQYPGHPLIDGDSILFDGVGTLPTGLIKNEVYTVTSAAENSFKVDRGAGAIDFDDDSSGAMSVYREVGSVTFDYAIDKINRWDHDLVEDDVIQFYDKYTSPQYLGYIPSGLSKATNYYVKDPDVSLGAVVFEADDNTVTLNGHTIKKNDPVVFTGAGTVPAELSKDTVYYAQDILANTFTVASTEDGAAIDFTDDGSGVISVNVVNFAISATAPGATIPLTLDTVSVRYNKWGVVDLTHFNVPTNPDSAPWTNIIRTGL